MRKRYYMQEEEGDLINLTPMLDVLFVVLILFMLAAPLLQVDHVALSHGSKLKESFSKKDKALVIQVTSSNEITIQGNKVPLELLPKTLVILKEKLPELCPTIYHDKAASFGTYQSLKTALEEAGFDAMDIILEAS